jgi:hypothetical protein
MHLKIIIFFCAIIIGLAIITNRWIMEKFYALVGQLFFRRQPDWERLRSAKVMTWVVFFSVVLALALAMVIKMMYNHAR